MWLLNESAVRDGVKYPSPAAHTGSGMDSVAEDIDDEDVEVIENVTRCPGCNSRQSHEVLREKQVGDGGIDYLIRCGGCGNVHTFQLRTPKPTMVNLTLSDGAESEKTEFEVDTDEVFTIGDEFELGDALWRITRLETGGDAKLRVADARDVRMIWATRCDLSRIKMTFTEGEHSTSATIEVAPDRMFQCGSMYTHKGERWRIRALHSGLGRTLYGKMQASKIRRIFLHKPMSEEDLEEREIRERGKWKGQDFPGREEHQRRISKP